MKNKHTDGNQTCVANNDDGKQTAHERSENVMIKEDSGRSSYGNPPQKKYSAVIKKGVERDDLRSQLHCLRLRYAKEVQNYRIC